MPRNHRRATIRHLLLLTAAAVAVLALPTAAMADAGATWPTGGQNQQNTRSQGLESIIGTGNVASLAPKWQFATGPDTVSGGDVSATPAVDGGYVYFPDSKGHLFAVNRKTGTVVWQRDIATITGIAGDYARATPALAGQTLIIGDQAGKFETPATDPAIAGAYVMGFDKSTGRLLWKTRVDPHWSAFVTASAQINGNVAYVGLASNEETFANALVGGQPYACCSFRGSVLALDVATGAIKWKTYMLPDEPGYSGASVWGSTPAIDTARNALYVATGNNYSLPAARSTCVTTATSDAAKRACLPGDHFDAIVALDLKTGRLNWSFEALPSDAWNVDCGLPPFLPGDTNDPSNCPPGAGPDYDFAQAPMLFSAKVAGRKMDLIGAGEKSGDFWTLDRDTGAKVWSTNVGPGGKMGGLQWGSATDGTRIYVAESNSDNLTGGWWAALDPATGATLWTRADPGVGLTNVFGFFGYSAAGPVATANGVVYACSLDPAGTMVAMDAATGVIRWQYASGSSCLGGAAIANGTVYWGTGYRLVPGLNAPGNKLFAFAPAGS